MATTTDLTGQTFGKWTIIGSAERRKDGHRRWLCRCRCGAESEVREDLLKNGRSAGCRNCMQWKKLNYTIIRTIDRKTGRRNRLYTIWLGMKARCDNPAHRAYHNYGDRGIKVCPEWHDDFQAFYDWAMANGYRDDLSIDRITSGIGYSPENCRWSTMKTQQNNRRNNRCIEFNGEKKTLTQWSEMYGIHKTTLADRLDRGWTMEEALGLVPKEKWKRNK